MVNQDRMWRRVMLILGISSLLFAGILIRLVQIQLCKWPEYAARAAAQYQTYAKN